MNLSYTLANQYEQSKWKYTDAEGALKLFLAKKRAEAAKTADQH